MSANRTKPPASATENGPTSEANTNRTTAALAATAAATAAIVTAPAITGQPAQAATVTRTAADLPVPAAYAPRYLLGAAEANRAHLAHVAHLEHLAHLRHLARLAARTRYTREQSARTVAYTGRHRKPANVLTDAGNYTSPQATASAMLSAHGWSQGQMGCLTELWDRESGWNKYAENPSSGAYGIPQALPGSKMASAGADWRTDAATQIRWGLSYVKAQYGSPCAAWNHSEADGWY